MSQNISFIVHLPGKPEMRNELYSSLIPVLKQMSLERYACTQTDRRDGRASETQHN